MHTQTFRYFLTFSFLFFTFFRSAFSTQAMDHWRIVERIVSSLGQIVTLFICVFFRSFIFSSVLSLAPFIRIVFITSSRWQENTQHAKISVKFSVLMPFNPVAIGFVKETVVARKHFVFFCWCYSISHSISFSFFTRSIFIPCEHETMMNARENDANGIVKPVMESLSVVHSTLGLFDALFLCCECTPF